MIQRNKIKSNLLQLVAKVFVIYSYVQRRVLLSYRDLKRFIDLNSYPAIKLETNNLDKFSHNTDQRGHDIYLLSRAYLETKYLHIRNDDGRMLSECTNWPDTFVLLSRPPSFSVPLNFYESIDVSGPVIALSSESYYHWLIEHLPIFFKLINAFPNSLVIHNKDAPKYVHDLLDLLGVQNRPVGKFVRVENLLFAPYEKSAGSANSSDVTILRKSFNEIITDSDEVELDNRAKIYISRRASSRSPAFELQLERHLAINGWYVISAEKVPLKQQYAIFSQAKVVMGLHGAGLSNIAFMPIHGKVVEIRILVEGQFHGNYMSNCYANLSISAGHSYHPIDLQFMEFSQNKVPPKLMAFLDQF